MQREVRTGILLSEWIHERHGSHLPLRKVQHWSWILQTLPCRTLWFIGWAIQLFVQRCLQCVWGLLPPWFNLQHICDSVPRGDLQQRLYRGVYAVSRQHTIFPERQCLCCELQLMRNELQ